jgi:hypothetical protein
MSANGHAVEVILAWCELPEFKEEKWQ